MITWSEIRAHVHACWPVGRSDEETILLVLDIDGRRQKIFLQRTRERARPALVVSAPVCSLRYLDPMEALEINATVEHGALAVWQGAYALRQLLPLDRQTAEDVDGAIRAGAIEAVHIARRVARPMISLEIAHAMFAYLTD
jgi:hypothetical protein